MKYLIIGAFVLLATFSTVAQTPTIYVEHTTNNNGVTFMKIVNPTPYMYGCWIRDQHNFVSISMPPDTYSQWYPVYGNTEWYCE